MSTPPRRRTRPAEKPRSKRRIDLWFTEANRHFFTASGVNLQIHLTHAEELDYVETPTFYELAPLYLTQDGIMDRVHAMRDAVGADVVHLVERWGA